MATVNTIHFIQRVELPAPVLGRATVANEPEEPRPARLLENMGGGGDREDLSGQERCGC
jgi:hypothetical protein